MSCRICGRNSCTESFHSIEEQNRADMTTRELEEYLATEHEKEIASLIEVYTEKIDDMKQENARLREALGEIVNGAIYPHEIAREALDKC